jgi:hypothetical protein
LYLVHESFKSREEAECFMRGETNLSDSTSPQVVRTKIPGGAISPVSPRVREDIEAENVIFLNTTYREKDEVKALGARWDPQRKKWFLGSEIEDLTPFTKWMNLVDIDHSVTTPAPNSRRDDCTPSAIPLAAPIFPAERVSDVCVADDAAVECLSVQVNIKLTF